MAGKLQGGQTQVPRSIGGFLAFTLRKILVRKRFLLLPLWVILAAVALLIFLGGGSSVLPVIYIAF